ncbi:MAG: TrmB family transcriptional regulator [Haloarculaceae archaeon]
MGDESVRDTLATFGLSETEIEAYLALLERGRATTGEIADAADVSRSYVYDVVRELSERGLVVVDESATPTELRARSPEEVTAALSSRVDTLESNLQSLYEESTDEPGFEIVRSRATVRQRARRLLDSADSEAFLVVPATELAGLADALAAARQRGVFVYLLLVAPDAATVAASADLGQYADVVRSWEAAPPILVLADESRGVMGSHGVLTGRHGDEYAFVFSQPAVASAFFGNAVGNYWPMASSEHVTEPDLLPETYDHLRTAVTNAALHRSAGRDLLADVRLRELDTDEFRSYERVPVVDIRQNLVGEPTNEFPMENSLVFDTPDGRIAAGNDRGGILPFYEGYAAEEVRLVEG